MADDPKADVPAVYEFSITHRMPPLSQYANYMLAQGDMECMYLHFFQLRPPILIEHPASNVAPPAIAEPVASVAIDIRKMQNFINVLQKQLNTLAKIAADAIPTP